MESSRPPRTLYFLAYAALYIIWGSTYLAIGFTVETIPPFFSGSLRFLIAGSILMAWCLFREKERPTRPDTEACMGGSCSSAATAEWSGPSRRSPPPWRP
ncbi:hypothetical protein MASR2M79_01610 [Aminivibrio sp.]